MGNVINKDNDTINWNNVKTDKFSEGNGTLFLSDDSKLLASRLVLNIPDVVASESDHLDIEKIFNKYQVIPEIQKNGSELSDTSPFISSEMYKYLMNKNQLNEVKVGGGLKQNGGAVEEDSSTSSTSSSEDVGSKGKHHDNKASKKHKKEVHKKHHEESEDSGKSEESGEHREDEEHEEDSDLESSGGASDNLSYISSSAHEGEASENSSNSNEESQENSNESTSASNSSQSVSNGNNEIPPSSINTSDINMISESS